MNENDKSVIFELTPFLFSILFYAKKKIITASTSQYRFQHFSTAWEDGVVSIFVFVERISPQGILDKFPVRGGCF